MTTGCLLLETTDGWRLAAAAAKQSVWHDVEGGLEVAPDALAAEVEQFVTDQGLSLRRVAIGLASSSTLSGSFTAASAADLRNRGVLGYRLEESLPVAAEDFVADFLSEDQQVLGVAVETRHLLPIVSALEALGLRVQTISPAALMALQTFAEPSSLGKYDLIALQHDSDLELFQVRRRVLGWHHLPANPQHVVRDVAVESLQAGGQLRMLLVNVSKQVQAALDQVADLDLECAETDSMTEAARRFAAAVLAGTATPWIELRRGELAVGDPYRAVRGAWRLCLASAALFLVALTVFFWIRIVQYDRAADAARERQRDLFHRAFPTARVPVAILSRFESEHTKLTGARGEEAKVRLPPSALDVLHALVTALPENVRLRVEQIRIENGQIDIDAEVRSVGDAGLLADALEKQGFVIEPPATEQRNPQSVATRLHGTLGIRRGP